MLQVRRLVNDYDLQQPWIEDKQLSDDKKFYFGDDKDFSIRYDSASDIFVLRDEVNGTEITFPKNVAMDVAAHAGRHSRGGADALDFSEITNLADSGDVDCAVGTGGSATRTTVLTLPSNWYNVLPKAVYMEVGGTVATGETVSISVKAVLDDGTELEIASYSTTGGTGSSTVGAETIWTNLLTNARSAGVSLDGRRITSIVADVESSATSTSATATVRAIGARS